MCILQPIPLHLTFGLKWQPASPNADLSSGIQVRRRRLLCIFRFVIRLCSTRRIRRTSSQPAPSMSPMPTPAAQRLSPSYISLFKFFLLLNIDVCVSKHWISWVKTFFFKFPLIKRLCLLVGLFSWSVGFFIVNFKRWGKQRSIHWSDGSKSGSSIFLHRKFSLSLREYVISLMPYVMGFGLFSIERQMKTLSKLA